MSEDAERPANLVDECGSVGGEVDAQHSGRELRRSLQLLTCGPREGFCASRDDLCNPDLGTSVQLSTKLYLKNSVTRFFVSFSFLKTPSPGPTRHIQKRFHIRICIPGDEYIDESIRTLG